MPASQVYGTRCLRPGFFGRRGLGGLCPHPPRFTHDLRRILRAEGARILRGRFELSGASDPDSSAGGASVGCAHTPHASRMTYDVFFARRALEYCVVDLSCPVPQTRILRPEGPRILDLGG